MDKTERMSSKEFLARTTITPAGRRAMQPPPAAPARLTPPVATATRFYIGLDPGRHTGFALWEGKTHGVPGRFVEVSTLTFWSAIRRMEKLVADFGIAALQVRIEDVRANKPTFRERDGNAAVRERMSQNIGSNKRDCQLLIEWMEHVGLRYDALPPRSRATGKGKVKAEFFAGVKGFPKKSSEHSRDASVLVIGL